MDRTTRRELLLASGRAAAGLSLLPLTGCAGVGGARGGGGRPWDPVTDRSLIPQGGYPLIKVAGSHREIGEQIAQATSGLCRDYLENSTDFQRCLAFLRGPGRRQVQHLLDHARGAFPHLIDELRGMSQGLDIPFLELFAYQCKSEIRILSVPDGCSTLATWRQGEENLLAHNEDGNVENAGRMFVLQVIPPSGIGFHAFVYPGLLPGNGPGFNSRGIVQTTNYIGPRRVYAGIPRYFISRAIMEAKSLNHAMALATTKNRAFPFHHNLCDLKGGKLFSLETHPKKYHLRQVKSLFLHTNHFHHPEMLHADPAQRLDVPYESSLTRYRVLGKRYVPRDKAYGADDLVRLLSSHEGRPYSPCRHPEGKVTGITLGTALFKRGQMAMTLYHGNPCLGIRREYSF